MRPSSSLPCLTVKKLTKTCYMLKQRNADVVCRQKKVATAASVSNAGVVKSQISLFTAWKMCFHSTCVWGGSGSGGGGVALLISFSLLVLLFN